MSLFLLIFGISILVAMLVYICVATWNKKIGVQLVFTLGGVGVISCIVVANAPNIAGLVLKYGDKATYGVELQRVEKKAQQVQTDAAEVRQMKKQIEDIVGRLEKSEQAAQEADKTLKGMQEQQAPRRLSDEQKRILVKALSPFRGQKVSLKFIMGDDNSQVFAKDFEDVLKSSEWEMTGGPKANPALFSSTPVGIELHLNEGEVEANRVPQSFDTLAKTLNGWRLLGRSALQKDKNIPAGEISIIVGRKPPVEEITPSPKQ